ncbi:MAG TPA: ATP-dependent DNA helicase RecG [Longimicrobiales bacterium]|nr:ATP-dependent DNA helicase RecG [Longimicrobiales bacterium]
MSGKGFLLDGPVQYLKGVGPRRAEQLDRLGIRSARDLLFHVPRRYEDASTVAAIASLKVGMDATVIGEVVSKGVLPTRKGLRIFQAVIRDATGLIECSWPGQPFLDRTIQKGDRLLVAGPVRFFHGRQIQPREYVVLDRAGDADGGKVLPIYPSTEGLSQKLLRQIIDANFDALLPRIHEEEPFAPAHLARVGIPALGDALLALHRPQTIAAAEHARRRLAYGELFFLQLLHARTRRQNATERTGISFRRSNALIRPFHEALPFDLTAAQTRVVREIFDDMMAPTRMNRLLQGDVGSGKTVVALLAMLLAAESGYQSALMAPTELLAEQHFRTLRALLGPVDAEVALLTGRQGKRERDAARAAVAGGSAKIVVGTHALIQEGVAFARLGLAVVDEQHRFGVRQRMVLAERGEGPDVLVMSATPIPRSLALTLYGDLDVSILDERPPGRRPVRTGLRPESTRGKVWAFVREQVSAGRQAYVVYPLIEESEKVDLKAATAEYETLSSEVFPDLRLGLMHGQMPTEEKDAVMQGFVAGDIDILVSTTVIEVGIDVPNAAVMVVEHAERFGLSQLHQLRGRIGRGAEQSWCVLIATGGPDSLERLRILTRTDDGFEIARADLRLRGMGDLFGAKQHGLPEFRFFDPEQDDDLLITARGEATRVVEDDPELGKPGHEAYRRELEARYGERARMYEVG